MSGLDPFHFYKLVTKFYTFYHLLGGGIYFVDICHRIKR